MHAAVYLYKVDQRVDTAIRIGHDEFVPLISQIPGFIGHYAIDLENDEGMLLAIFRDEAGINRFNEVAQEWVQKRVIPELGPPYDQAPVRALTGRVKAFNSPNERRLDLR